MNKLFTKIGVFSLLMGVTLYSWAGPCRSIAMACMQNGYSKGHGLIKECVMPVAMGTKTLPNTKFTPDQLQGCKMKMAEKMKGKMQQQAPQQPTAQQ